MKYMAIIDSDEKPVSCEFIGCNGNVAPYLIGATNNIKAIEQEPCDDVIAIHTQGLDEGIRCAMCTNSMKSNRGCDGGCVVNECMYREVMNTIENHIVPPVTPTRKKGKWINGDPICPCCGENKFKDLDADIWADWKPKFCPNCGAKMESEDKE